MWKGGGGFKATVGVELTSRRRQHIPVPFRDASCPSCLPLRRLGGSGRASITTFIERKRDVGRGSRVGELAVREEETSFQTFVQRTDCCCCTTRVENPITIVILLHTHQNSIDMLDLRHATAVNRMQDLPHPRRFPIWGCTCKKNKVPLTDRELGLHGVLQRIVRQDSCSASHRARAGRPGPRHASLRVRARGAPTDTHGWGCSKVAAVISSAVYGLVLHRRRHNRNTRGSSAEWSREHKTSGETPDLYERVQERGRAGVLSLL